MCNRRTREGDGRGGRRDIDTSLPPGVLLLGVAQSGTAQLEPADHSEQTHTTK